MLAFSQRDSCEQTFDDAFNRWNALTLKVANQESESINVNVGSGHALMDDLYSDNEIATRYELNSNLYVIGMIKVRHFVFSFKKREILFRPLHFYLSNPLIYEILNDIAF